MKNFSYARAADPQSAVAALCGASNMKLLAGGTNLVDLMRENIELPDALLDITSLGLDRVDDLPNGGLRIGATATNTAVAQHRLVRERYPVLAQAIVCGASGQIRNMATVGGNLMQRTRCLYFYDRVAHCNKREPQSGCDALSGFNRMHAILGASQACVATHPSDMCVALAMLDAKVNVVGPAGERSVAMTDFHKLPGDTPQIETELSREELILSVDLPPLSGARNSSYRKVRDRASYAFALVSVAAAMSVTDGVVEDLRLALGGVAHKPWRAFQAERVLRGARANPENFRRAAEAELEAARGLSRNGFKIELAARTIVSVLNQLSQGT